MSGIVASPLKHPPIRHLSRITAIWPLCHHSLLAKSHIFRMTSSTSKCLTPNDLTSSTTSRRQPYFSFTDLSQLHCCTISRFFVAIPPSRRNEWGQQMRTLIKPGGYLITLIYPIDPQTPTGPPYFVRPDHYFEPLGDGWIKVVDRIPENSLKSHIGREHLVVWKRL